MKKILQKIIVIILLGLTCFNTFSPIYVNATTSHYEIVKQEYIEEFLQKLNDIIDEHYDYKFYTMSQDSYAGIIELILQPSLTSDEGPYSDRFPEDIYDYDAWYSWVYIEDDEFTDDDRDMLKEEVNDYIYDFASYGNLYNFLLEKKYRDADEFGVFNYEAAKAELHELFLRGKNGTIYSMIYLVGRDGQNWDQIVESYLEDVASYKNKRKYV